MIDSMAIVSIVAAAFFASGGLKAGTPLETASTPVMAVQPLENAVSSRNTVSACPPGAIGATASTGCTVPLNASMSAVPATGLTVLASLSMWSHPAGWFSPPTM